jgi:hypothetical protein
VHVAAQTLPLQAKFALHVTAIPVQVPLLHSGSVSVETPLVVAHELAPQLVLSATLQLPEPLQLSPLQPDTLAAHSFFGSLPAVALMHVMPVGSTTWQSGQGASVEAAHTFCDCPCRQLPEMHWPGRVQGAPLATFARHFDVVESQ